MQSEMWAIVELMGHVRLAGRVSEEEKFGAKIGRIDIPQLSGGKEIFVTQFFGGSSVYRITAVSEAAARAVATANELHPIHSYEMPQSTPALTGSTHEQNDEKEEDDFEYPF